jgi:hypothetical protein
LHYFEESPFDKTIDGNATEEKIVKSIIKLAEAAKAANSN